MVNYFIGIDVGTQGVRTVFVDQNGNVLAASSVPFTLTASSREEQSPQHWWESCREAMGKMLELLPPDVDRSAVLAVAVASTSGTVIPLDSEYQPLHDALMYSDTRSASEGRLCQEVAERHVVDGYTGFNASSGLSKMVWYTNRFPETAHRIGKWIHAADYITGMLSGNFDTTDYTNALKSGYDVGKGEWPPYLTTQLPLKKEWLQEVVASGEPVGRLHDELGKAWGLPQIQVVAGMTDGCASQIASGAVKPGDWNTTIGTTLVIKGVTKVAINDPQGRIYSHRHPDGYWMPGGASNTGADWVSTDFGTALQHLNELAATLIPTGKLAWPLKQQGERFPFIAPHARGFAPDGLSEAERFAANMEGVAYIERLAYELIEQLSGERVAAVYTAGGGSNSDVWLTIRSNVLKLPIYKSKEANGAVGAAIGAASKTYYGSIAEAAEQMTTIEREIVPEAELMEAYEVNYHHFIDEMKKRKYI
ncbi:FGGY-family carbohydrate kinase [Parapedobacter tibetensis]|uniref:FGGY-family carbohydrate kinase n=1 Tax=Parapedobacter tibetensis TaxID=2972951 RepID=UPI00214DB8F3|nr:FGGY-family carbohydrate kinase [Parapedobacter tibetensis]